MIEYNITQLTFRYYEGSHYFILPPTNLNILIHHIYNLNKTELLSCPVENTFSILMLKIIIMAAVLVNTIRIGLSFEYKVDPIKFLKHHIVSLIVQFIIAPLTGLLIIFVLDILLTPFQKMSIAALCACPGGIACTGFAEPLGGNKEKAARISTMSVLLSPILTPVMLVLMSFSINYNNQLFTNKLRTYVCSILCCLVFVLAPLVFSVILRKCSETKDNQNAFTKITKILFVLEVLLNIGTVVFMIPMARPFATKYMIVIGLTLPFICFAVGYFSSILLHSIILLFNSCFSQKVEPITEYMTFAISTGIQNNRLAMVLLYSWSFWTIDDFHCHKAFLHAAIGPGLYGFSMLCTGALGIFTKASIYKNKEKERQSINIDGNNNIKETDRLKGKV